MTDEKFWLTYLFYHRKRATRILHYTATALFSLAVILSLLTKALWLFLIALCLWWGLIIFSHSCIESNGGFLRRHPVLTVAYCFRMSFSALTGHISEDLAKTATISASPPENW